MYRNDDLKSILRNTGVSSVSIDTAETIIKDIFESELEPINKNEQDPIKDWEKRRKICCSVSNYY
jgi:hypothetical protein